MNEKEIKKGLRCDMVLSEQVERKIQDAYEKVRRESAQRKDTEVIVRIRHRNKRRWMVIAAVAVLALGTTIGTVASNRFFTFTRNDDEVLFTFNFENYPICKKVFEVEASYLPEGYKEKDGKYYKENDESKESGITIAVENTASWANEALSNPDGATKSIWNVEEVEETGINGMDTYIFIQKPSNGIVYNPTFLFNIEEGYIISLFTTSDIPIEEIKKIAQGLKVTDTGQEVEWYDENLNSKLIQIVAYNVTSEEESIEEDERLACTQEEMISLNEPFIQELDGQQIELTVKSAKYVESCKGYDTEYFINYEEEVLPYLNEDGTAKPHWRQPIYEGENLDFDEEEQIEQVFLEVKIHAENLSDEEVYTGLYMGTRTLEKEGEIYRYPEITYANVTDDIPNEFQIYFDARENFEGIKGKKEVLFRTLQPEEELDYTILLMVDKDQKNQTYLEIPSNDDEIAPRFVDLGFAK